MPAILLHPRMQFLVYLVVGGWNTVFGIGFYWLLFHLFGSRCHYLVLAVVSNVVAITNAFVCYKLLVFRTRGNWLREYLKCWVVYGGGALLTMALMWVFVDFAGISPVWANVVGTALVTVASYFGHKYFSFGRKKTIE